MKDIFPPLTRYLNKISNYLIDWTRVGELLRSGRHNYTLSELIPRGFIGISMVIPIVIYQTISWMILLQVALCFIVSHSIVISHLVWKRYKMKTDCDGLVKSIKKNYCKCDSNNQKNMCQTCIKIDSIFSKIIAKSSAVWGYRKRKLIKLENSSNT